MKRLILMRHAEAERSVGSDIEREITAKGEEQALAAAAYLKGYKIDHILCSPAKRTERTLRVVQKYIGFEDNLIQTSNAIYTNIVDELSLLLSQMLIKGETMLIVGHNPSLLEFAVQLAPNSEEKFHSQILLGLKPAEVIVLEFPEANSWEDAASGNGVIKDIFIKL